MAAWKRCCDMQKVCGYNSEDRKRCNVRHKCSSDIQSNCTVIWWYLYWYMPNLLKVLECKHTMRVFAMPSIWSLFRRFCKFVFAEFLTTWVRVEIVMFDSRMVICSIFWSYSLHFLLATNTIRSVYELHLHGRQFEFPEAKVVVRCWTLWLQHKL